MRGFYHSVETFGTVDGPGIRYVLFLAGCDLKCRFCHNPDTWHKGRKQISVDEVLAQYEEYRLFYDASGGGITVSGGEPLLQPRFVRALLAACKDRRIHIVIDTGGYYPTDNMVMVADKADAVQFSLKAADPVTHRRLTGRDNELIVENLRLAAGLLPVTLRYVVIPGINDTLADIHLLAELITSLPRAVNVELLAYHTLGRRKWEALSWPYTLPDVPPARPEDLARVSNLLAGYGIAVI